MSAALSETVARADSSTYTVAAIARLHADHAEADRMAIEAGIIARAEDSFSVWWNAMGEVDRRIVDGFALWKAYKAGQLSMARELGILPGGAR